MNYSVYNSSIENFIEKDINQIVLELKRFNPDSGKSEINSWKNSLSHLQNIFKKTFNLKDITIIIECFVPNAHNKIDVVLLGENNGNSKIILIELKQWSDENVCIQDGTNLSTLKVKFDDFKIMRHPAIQVYSYKKQLEMYNESLCNVSIIPIVYLHNYESDDIKNKNIFSYHNSVEIFCKSDNFEEYLSQQFTSEDNGNRILDSLLNGKIKPNKKLAEVISSILKGNEEYILDEYQDSIMKKAIKYYDIPRRKYKGIIIEGAPGTGKSVIAINLLSYFLSKKINTVYITKNMAPRTVFSAMIHDDLEYNANQIFVNPSRKKFDISIVDEAHRLNINQFIDVLNNSNFVICFIDGKQMIHCEDIGSKENIYNLKNKNGKSPFNYKQEVILQNQYRCSSMSSYIKWLDSILYNKTIIDKVDFIHKGYDFKLFKDINSFNNAISIKHQKFVSTRIVAGYCWEWKSKDNVNLIDIEIGDFKKQWNLNSYENGQRSASWIIQNSFNQIGCIHTCQGLEVDYIGVIIGDDLFFEDDLIKTNSNKRAKDDFTIKKCNDDYNKLDEIIRNTYRVLLTRGIKGCYVYCTNKDLYDYFESSLKGLFK